MTRLRTALVVLANIAMLSIVPAQDAAAAAPSCDVTSYQAQVSGDPRQITGEAKAVCDWVTAGTITVWVQRHITAWGWSKEGKSGFGNRFRQGGTMRGVAFTDCAEGKHTYRTIADVRWTYNEKTYTKDGVVSPTPHLVYNCPRPDPKEVLPPCTSSFDLACGVLGAPAQSSLDRITASASTSPWGRRLEIVIGAYGVHVRGGTLTSYEVQAMPMA